MLLFRWSIVFTLFAVTYTAPPTVDDSDIVSKLNFDNFALNVLDKKQESEFEYETTYADDPIVTLPHGGQLRGKVKSISLLGKKYNSFKGIRYAQPPVGELRFKSPVSYPSWEGVVDAQSHGASCIQPGYVGVISGAEDCLFLNVYSPNLEPKEKLAVMVWIHGGSFTSGSGDAFTYGPEYIVDQNVVLVTINYRIGWLGFLSTGDKHAQGNYGLKDAVEALRWVKQNIGAFGGDPNHVTIFGESSGAAMVHYLVLSNMADGLFNAAISQSGLALNPWSFQDKPREAAFRMAEKLNINATDTEDLMKQLMKITDEKEFARVTPTLLQTDIPRGNNPLQVSPCVEPSDSLEPRFLSDHPLKILREGTFNHVPYIIGNTDTEALFAVREPLVTKDILEIFNKNPSYLLPYEWHVDLDSFAANDIIAHVKDMYFQGGNITDILDYVRFVSDRSFDYASYKAVELHAAHQKQPIFYYIFSFDGFLNYIKKLLLVTSYEGAMHADDIGYFWKLGGISVPILPSSDTAITQKRMLRMWTDFAKTFDPTPVVDDLIQVKWPPVHPDYEMFEYIDIGKDLTINVGMFRDRMKMWRELDQKYGYNP